MHRIVMSAVTIGRSVAKPMVLRLALATAFSLALSLQPMNRGLPIIHDIIIKQHTGSIEVETQPWEFTEFRIVLPRSAAFLAKSGGRA
jgi:hypothetical protein